jgi:hypothetical protein
MYKAYTGPALELAALLALNLAGNIHEQTLQHIDPLEIINQSCVLGLAFLQQVVLVQYGLHRDVLFVEQAVNGGRIMEPKSGSKRSVLPQKKAA